MGGGAEGSGLVPSEERMASGWSNKSPLDLQGGYHGEGVRLLLRCTVGGCIDNLHKLKRELTEYMGKNFPCEDSQARELVAQRGCAVSTHGGFQDPAVLKVLSNLDSAVSRRSG